MEKLKFGIIGAGRISDMHAPAYINNPRAEIYAVCDKNEEVAKRRMREWNCKKYYSADERVEITGEKGVIWITRCTGKLLDLPPLILYKDGKTTYFENIRCDWLDSFSDSVEHFIDCIIYDREPRLTGEQGKKVMQFAIAAYISAKEKREVRPDEIVGEERCL
jgi:predicted dehydrogenase